MENFFDYMDNLFDYAKVYNVNIVNGMTKTEFNLAVDYCVKCLTGQMSDELSKSETFSVLVYETALKHIGRFDETKPKRNDDRFSKGELATIIGICCELTKINTNGEMRTSYSFQQVLDCYKAFGISEKRGQQYYKKLEEFVKEHGSANIDGRMYTPGI